jgi:hypothetical protein
MLKMGATGIEEEEEEEYTRLGTTSNYSATTNHHNSEIRTPAYPFAACCVFTSLSLATASNSGDSSASRVQVLTSKHSVQNSTNN